MRTKGSSSSLSPSISPRLSEKHTHTLHLSTRKEHTINGRQRTKPPSTELLVQHTWMSPKMEAHGGVGAGALIDASCSAGTDRCGELKSLHTACEEERVENGRGKETCRRLLSIWGCSACCIETSDSRVGWSRGICPHESPRLSSRQRKIEEQGCCSLSRPFGIHFRTFSALFL